MPFRSIIKKTTHGDSSASSVSNDNRCSIFEKEDEDIDDEDYKSNHVILLTDEK